MCQNMYTQLPIECVRTKPLQNLPLLGQINMWYLVLKIIQNDIVLLLSGNSCISQHRLLVNIVFTINDWRVCR